MSTSTSATDNIKEFNEIMDSLLIQIAPISGTSFSYKFKQIIKYNSILPIEQFLVHTLPYREKIINKDETYFFMRTEDDVKKVHEYWGETIKLKEKVLHNKDNATEEKHKRAINEILRLQNIYEVLDDESKTNIWDIFNALLVLGEEYIKIKYSN